MPFGSQKRNPSNSEVFTVRTNKGREGEAILVIGKFGVVPFSHLYSVAQWDRFGNDDTQKGKALKASPPKMPNSGKTPLGKEN